MSTRASILVKEGDDKCYIYHHCDGYPAGIGIDMKKYLSEIKGCWWIDEIVTDLIKGNKCGETHNIWANKTTKGDNGYEWTSCVHGDEEYYYLIDCDKKEIHCYVDVWMNEEVEIKEENE